MDECLFDIVFGPGKRGSHVREKPASEGNLPTRGPKAGIHRPSLYSYPPASADLTLFFMHC